ncbi:MAG: hypothetical protein FRX49_13674 [Trebouxia sp. A1-2]|nr:MAG: hypothetical protein FRX49_13674 [Trebouxia sp. A1-2]
MHLTIRLGPAPAAAAAAAGAAGGGGGDEICTLDKPSIDKIQAGLMVVLEAFWKHAVCDWVCKSMLGQSEE